MTKLVNILGRSLRFPGRRADGPTILRGATRQDDMR